MAGSNARLEVSGAGKTEDGLVQYNEEVNKLGDDLRELYETIRVNVDEEEQWKVFDFVEDFFMEELEIGDYINDINSYHLHMFDKHDVTTKKLDVIVEKAGKVDAVVLGKYGDGGPTAYTSVAKDMDAQYFQLDNWDELAARYSDDEIWKINEKFLDIQTSSRREIYLSHNPEDYLGKGQFYSRELQYLLDSAIEKKDIFKIATEPTWDNLTHVNMFTGKTELTGFGREYAYLKKYGYYFDTVTKTMVK